MKDVTNYAFTEVHDIINHMEENIKTKIPNGFRKIIEDNMDNTYQVNIDYSKSINEQKLLQETRVLLSLIYRDYICTPQEKANILRNDEMKLQKQEEILRKKYEIDFNKRQKNIQSNNKTKFNSNLQSRIVSENNVKNRNIFKMFKKES